MASEKDLGTTWKPLNLVNHSLWSSSTFLEVRSTGNLVVGGRQQKAQLELDQSDAIFFKVWTPSIPHVLRLEPVDSCEGWCPKRTASFEPLRSSGYSVGAPSPGWSFSVLWGGMGGLQETSLELD